ncbi:MAG: AAA family ATPase [Geminicoccaceae bacterium]|nr:AAA family ATPase [Geminicoccaceae bacterium]
MTADFAACEAAVRERMEAPVERIETHAAVILLGGDAAFKLKKRVVFSFLDFRTSQARERALRNELELNRRTAPELYVEVLPITVSAGRAELDGSGEIVDWVLRMHRFPQSARLDRVARDEGLSAGLAEALGTEIARFHARLAPLFDKGGVVAHREIEAGNEEDLRRSVPAILDRDEVESFILRVREAREVMEPLLESRREGGFVRQCHGDLHLENIALVNGKPVLFDAIEFNDDFAGIDTIYDLAFLVMDLLERRQREAAWQLLDAYLGVSFDHQGLALLPFFLATRAAIRAKIEAFAGHREAAGAYLRFAGFSLDPPPPRLVAVGGLSGTGKTTIARAIAPGTGADPGAVLLRSDVIRKRLMGVAPAVRLGDEAYGGEVTGRVFEALFAMAATLLDAGRTVILDAVFARPEQRAAAAAVAREAGVPFTGFWLETSSGQRLERVVRRTGDASDADARVVGMQDGYDVGDIDWIRIDTGGSRNESIERVRHHIGVSTKCRHPSGAAGG